MNSSPAWSALPAAGPRCVGELIASCAAVDGEERVREVAERFFREPGLEAVAVLREGRPVGLLTRPRLLLRLARGFGQELWARKPVTRIADPAALVVSDGTPLEAALALALGREPGTVYEEILVVGGDGRFRGLLPVRELVLRQSVAYARSSAERQAAVARAQDLERVEHLRAQFLAHATHELRSPVNALVALGEILQRACARGDLPAVRGRLALLLQCAVGLRGTINDLLDLSRLEAGRMEVATSQVELEPLLREVATTTRLLLGDKPVAVRVVVAAGARVETDPQKLRRILVNLASNAAKFTDQGAIGLSAGVGEAGATLAVEDTGCGIAPRDFDRLFVPFGQLEDALTQVHEGTGLGLVICRSLARVLGGRIEVCSQPGQGSTFTVHLPPTPPGARTDDRQDPRRG